MLRVIISSILAVIAIFIGFFPHSNNHTLTSIFKIKQTKDYRESVQTKTYGNRIDKILSRIPLALQYLHIMNLNAKQQIITI